MAARETLLGSAVSFAHLQGISKPLGKKSRADDGDDKPDDDDKEASRKQGEDESDDDYAKRMESEDDDAGDDDDDSDKSAEADDTDPGDDDDKDKKDSKSKAAYARGVKAEKIRTSSVLSSKAFVGNPALGAWLMKTTSMSAKQILGVLRDSPAASAAHPHRAAGNPQIGPSGAPTPSGPVAIESRWTAAFKRAGVLK